MLRRTENWFEDEGRELAVEAGCGVEQNVAVVLIDEPIGEVADGGEHGAGRIEILIDGGIEEDELDGDAVGGGGIEQCVEAGGFWGAEGAIGGKEVA